jgi:uncharacterized protein YuzE
MKILYDKQAETAYIQLETTTPDGVIEIDDGVHLDTTADNRIVGIEILSASKRISLPSLFVYEIESPFASAA